LQAGPTPESHHSQIDDGLTRRVAVWRASLLKAANTRQRYFLYSKIPISYGTILRNQTDI
jgi:hypothetical protein